MLKWEIPGSALGSAPEGASGNRGAPGSAPESGQEDWGAPGSAPESALLVNTPQEEHPREHSLEHPNLPEAPSAALPRALPGISHFSTLVTGGCDCNFGRKGGGEESYGGGPVI